MNYQDIIRELVKSDDRIVIMTAENRGAIRQIPNEIGDRFIDTGITEMTMIGSAAGLALRGRIPVTHALATFLTLRAYEFIVTDVGIPGLPVKLVGAVPGFLSEANGPTHQAIEDVAILRCIPNMQIFAPADEEDMVLGLKQVLTSPNPCYVRYNSRKAATRHSTSFDIGKAEVLNQGKDITILVYGTLFTEAFETRAILEKHGLSVGLVNLRMVNPIDDNAILEAARESKLLVTLEDHFLTGGLFSIVSEILVKNERMAKVLPIALDNRWFKPALLNDVLEYEGFTPPQLAQKITRKWETII